MFNDQAQNYAQRSYMAPNVFFQNYYYNKSNPLRTRVAMTTKPQPNFSLLKFFFSKTAGLNLMIFIRNRL